MVIPVREDKQYRSWKRSPCRSPTPSILYMMDVSGSMTDEQKEIVRIEAFWIDTWIKSHYEGVTTRYIIHDAVAQEVDEHTFYHTRESGGTKISSAYDLANKIIDADYPPDRLERLRLPLLRRRQLGRRHPPVHRACSATSSCPSATCSATARSRAPTARASSTASSRRRSRTCPTWPSPRSATRTASSSRSRNSSAGGVEFA